MTYGLALVATLLGGFGAWVWRDARRLASRARTVAAFQPAPAGPAVAHASAPARLVASRIFSGNGPSRRRVEVPLRAIAAGTGGELRVSDVGLAFGDRLFPHAAILDLSLLEEAAGERAERTKSLLAVTLELAGGPLELVFAIDGPRVTAERVRREVHVRGARVQEVLAGVLSKPAPGHVP